MLSHMQHEAFRLETIVWKCVFFSHSKQIKGGLRRQTDLLLQASKEVEKFCDDHSWIAEIHQFVSSWADGHTDAWRGQPTVKIEVRMHIVAL